MRNDAPSQRTQRYVIVPEVIPERTTYWLGQSFQEINIYLYLLASPYMTIDLTTIL